MWVSTTSFWTPKAGNAPGDYEDAFWPKYRGTREGTSLRFAVADGATEGVLNGEWADILVRTFGHCSRFDPQTFLMLSYKRWNAWKKRYLINREKENRPILWYEEPGLRSGAFSTFLGFVLTDTDDYHSKKWKAVGIGDTCLFQVRQDSVITRFPIESSSDFSNRPMLLCSNPVKNKDVGEKVKLLDGECLVDDTFFLMTDALACWFLNEFESGCKPWQILRDLEYNRKSDVEIFISDLRNTGRIQNDDVTLVYINVNS